MQGKIIGFDIGGSKLRVARYNSDGKILNKRIFEPERGDKNKLLCQIQGIVQDGYKGNVYSFGFPGPVYNGDLIKAPPLNLNDRICGFELEELLKGNVVINNDMRNAAEAELRKGIGEKQRKPSFFLLTISSGIGGALTLYDSVYDEFPCEFGHSVLERDLSKANKCSCGNLGCWVAQASGYGILESARREIENSKIITGNNIELRTAEDVFKLAKEDSREGFICKSIIKNAREYNAQGLGNIVNVFSPVPIVIIGGLGLGQFKEIIPRLEEIKKYTVNPVPEIMRSELGDNAGLLGAWLYARSIK